MAIDYVRLQSAITTIEKEEKNLKDLFDKQNANFEKLENSNDWQGMSKESCIAKYKELSSKYEEILSNLSKYRSFLYNTGESYKSIVDKADIDNVISNN